jgi:transcriptional regulator with XRE-family HTH domain
MERRNAMKLTKLIARRIKTLREAAGLSQQEVAVRGELSLSLVAKLEQGKKADPRASTLLALGRALSVKPGQILDDLPVPTAEAETPTVGVAVVPATADESGDVLEEPPKAADANGAGPAKGKKKGKKKAKGSPKKKLSK